VSRLRHLRLPRATGLRLVLVAALIPLVVVAVLWHGPDLGPVEDAFSVVEWEWVAVAFLVNLASIGVRSIAWKIVIDQAVPPPRPRHRNVFAAFAIGLLGNAALPGRVGEVARVIVLTRRMRRRPGTWATVVGTVFTHRLLDFVVAIPLVVYVVYVARIPDWARPALAIVLGVGVGVLVAALFLARRQARGPLDDLGGVRRMLRMARLGLTVLKRPAPALGALTFQILGWTAQLLAVWVAFSAFGIDSSIAMAALVLVLMNVVTVFPLWPGNVGILQVTIAAALLPYGVGYARGFAYAIGVQAIEVAVGVALGLLFLAREGVSFAMLRRMPEVTEVEVDERVERIA
jgi:uncharacterized membrane protein YbhN (UPF0104 family)